MKISKRILAFFAAAAVMVGCSEGADNIVDPTNPGNPGEKMVKVSLEAGMKSTRVDASLTDDMGLSFSWDEDKSDIIRFVPFAGSRTDLTITSIDNWINSTAIFGGNVVIEKDYRLLVAKKGITYGQNNETATLTINNQNVIMDGKSTSGFYASVPDNMFLINNDGVRKGVTSNKEIPSVTFEHINSCVVFRVKFADGALDGVQDYKITDLKLNNVASAATLNLRNATLSNSNTGDIHVGVTTDLAAEESMAVADEYWIPVSVFPGLTESGDATVTVDLNGTVDGKTMIGHVTFGLNDLMNGDYAAGTNNAITLAVKEVLWADITPIHSAVYLKARTEAGVESTVGFSYSCKNFAEAGDITITTDNPNIKLYNKSVKPTSNSGNSTISFLVQAPAKESTTGNIIIKWGEAETKRIPVYYENNHEKSVGDDSFVVAGQTAPKPVSSVGYNMDILSTSGAVKANTEYDGRYCQGVITDADGNQSVVYVAQASNFELIDNQTGKEAIANTEVTYKSTGVTYKVNGAVTAISKPFSYTVKGDIDSNFSGAFGSQFNQTGGWGNLENGRTFTFSANNIGHNQGEVYVAANSHLESKPSVTFTNFANETKTYTFDIDQYAKPYPETGYTEDEEGRWKFKGGEADMYEIGGDGKNRGAKLESIYVRNCFYEETKNFGDNSKLGYYWADDAFSYVGTYEEKNALIYAIAVGHEEPSTGRHHFWGLVKDHNPGLTHRKKASGYFVLTIGNEADEKIQLYVHYTRNDW